MRAHNILFTVLAASMLIGACAEDPPTTLGGSTSSASSTGSGQTSAARAYFDQSVETIFEGTCSDCHSNPGDDYGAPDFLGFSPDDYYGGLTGRVDFVSCDIANSILLLKGADPGHAGPPLTEGQHDKVEQWLKLEAEERFGGSCSSSDPPTTSSTTAATTSTGTPEPAPLTGEMAMKQFGDCMTLEDWNATGMPLVANQLSDYGGNNVPCYSCHANGTGENWMPDPKAATAEADIAEAFEALRYMYASFNLVRWTVNNEDGSFKDLVPSYRWRDKGQEGTSHPMYTLDPTYLQYYEDWFALTYEKWSTGACQAGGGGSGGSGGGGN